MQNYIALAKSEGNLPQMRKREGRRNESGSGLVGFVCDVYLTIVTG